MADPFNKSNAVKHEAGFDTTSLKDKSVLVTGGELYMQHASTGDD